MNDSRREAWFNTDKEFVCGNCLHARKLFKLKDGTVCYWCGAEVVLAKEKPCKEFNPR